VDQIVRGYDERYKDEGLTYLQVEWEIRNELPGGHTFEGHIDKLAQDANGRIWVMDHKSHKQLPNEDARFSDLQLAFYVASCKQNDIDVSGLVWDYLRTKLPAVPEVLKNGELSKRQNIDTTWPVYLAEVKRLGLDPRDYKDMQSLLEGNEVKFYRRVWLPSPNASMIKSIVRDISVTAHEIEFLSNHSKVRNLQKDCTQCEFYQLCHAELRGMDAEFIRETDYVVEEPEDEKDESED
jgi:hypothetical protein